MDDIVRMLQELSDEEVGDNFEDFDSDSDLSDENIVFLFLLYNILLYKLIYINKYIIYCYFDNDSEHEEVEAMYTDELYYTGVTCHRLDSK
jgi:hypothetical protein